MRDMAFQIEKMKVLRANTVGSVGKPAQVMIGLCDVMLEILAEMQGMFLKKTEFVPEQMDVHQRRIEVVEMLQVCANELENKTLFPSIDQTEVVLFTNLSKEDTIEKNASFLIREIVRTIARHK